MLARRRTLAIRRHDVISIHELDREITRRNPLSVGQLAVVKSIVPIYGLIVRPGASGARGFSVWPLSKSKADYVQFPTCQIDSERPSQD